MGLLPRKTVTRKWKKEWARICALCP